MTLYPDLSRISGHFKNYLKSIAHYEHYLKNKTLLSPSEPGHKMWYIKRGAAKIYHYTIDDHLDQKENVTCLLKEGDIICRVDTFFGRERSSEYVELLEDADLYVITEVQLDECFKLFPEAHALAREIIMGYKKRSDLRAHLLSIDAALRYKEFSKLFHMGRFSVSDITSYLNLSRSHFSRIRKRR